MFLVVGWFLFGFCSFICLFSGYGWLVDLVLDFWAAFFVVFVCGFDMSCSFGFDCFFLFGVGAFSLLFFKCCFKYHSK